MSSIARCVRSGAVAASAGCLLMLVGCSGAGSMTGGTTVTSNSAPAVVSVTDAPLGNILSAQATISSVTANPTGSGAAVALLSAPVTVELAGLSGIQEPLEISSIPLGTYGSLTATVSAVTVTYVSTTGQTVSASATLVSPVVTVPLNPPLGVTTSSGVDLHLAFNLAQSFSMSGGAVTFTPVIKASGADIESEGNGDRNMRVTGSVVSVSNTSIVLQSGDSGHQFTFTINPTTQLPTGFTISTIPVGSIVQVMAQTQPDGTMLALSLTVESGMQGGSGEMANGASGIITSVQMSGGAVIGFTMVPREDFGSMGSGGSMGAGMPLTVTVSPSTTFGLSQDAMNAGIAQGSFNAGELYAGQSVEVSGIAVPPATLTASQITLAGEGFTGTLSAAPQGSLPNLNLLVNLSSTSFLATYGQVTNVAVVTSQFTNYGNGLTAAALAASAIGASIEVHGYLVTTGPGVYVLYADEVNAAETETGAASPLK